MQLHPSSWLKLERVAGNGVSYDSSRYTVIFPDFGRVVRLFRLIPYRVCIDCDKRSLADKEHNLDVRAPGRCLEPPPKEGRACLEVWSLEKDVASAGIFTAQLCQLSLLVGAGNGREAKW